MDQTPRSIKKYHRGLFLLVGGFTLIAVLLFAGSFVKAVSFEDPSSTLGLGTADLKDTVFNIINWALGLLGIVAVIMILYGGYTWLTAAGNEEKIARAKRIIVNAVIGIVIILLSWAIVNFVIKTTGNVTNPGGDVCTDGDIEGCFRCSGGDWLFDSGICPLPSDNFEVRKIVTSCGDTGDYQSDVHLCSAVTVVFNRPVDTDNVQELVENLDALRVEQCSDASCSSATQPQPLFNAPPTEIEYSGTSPAGDKAEFVVSGKSITFLHQHQLFPENTYFRLTLPRALTDTAGKSLSVCNVPGCNDGGSEFQWTFQTGSDADSEAPTLVASYPKFSTETGYPDRSVNRNAVLTGRFSEGIAPWTITESNIQLFSFSTPPDDSGNGGTVGSAIDPSKYDVVINGGGDGYELVFVDGFQLDAFAWYEIRVHDLEDLCGNTQDPSPLTWRFETNGVGAGISMVYPADGSSFSCPSTEVFIRFNTSMYDPLNGTCAVSAGGTGGFVTAGSIIPSVPRSFTVEDDYPGFPANPNDYCKKYSWRPTSSQLNDNQAYSVNVQTRLQIDADGTMLQGQWNFRTATADTCANAPYVDRVSPSSGPAGTCLSVIGNYFDSAPPAGRGPNDDLTFRAQSTPSTSWTDRAIVADAPNIANGPAPVQVKVDYGGGIGTLLSNNDVQFTVTPGTFTGPCLYNLAPDNGPRGKHYQLIGKGFDPSSTIKRVRFGADIITENWTSDTVANSTVPDTAVQGVPSDVRIENEDGVSNPLPFFVPAPGPGGGGDGSSTLTVTEYVPGCDSACSNADVRVRFSDALDPTTVTSDTVELFRCATLACDSGFTEVTTAFNYVPGTRDVHFPQQGGMNLNTGYRAIIRSGSSGVHSIGGNTLGGLNYDSDGTGGADSYSWTFLTAIDNTQCDFSYNDVEPVSAQVPIDGTRNYAGFAYSEPNDCNPGGEELNPYDYVWDWSSEDTNIATVSPTGPLPMTMATGVAASTDPIQIRGRVVSESSTDFGLLTVLPDQCVTNSDCDPTPGDGMCDNSQCVASRCTPVVDSMTPTSGAVGSYVTVNGCYFGSYVDGSSKVEFLQDADSPDLTGLWPQPSICGDPGSTWHDSSIIVEAPNKRTSDTGDDVKDPGPLKVTRGDAMTAMSSQSFDPSGDLSPGICRVSPGAGQAGTTTVTLEGQNFGAAEGTVTFYNNEQVDPANITWESDSRVKALVPGVAVNNTDSSDPLYPNEIYLSSSSGIDSNPVNFDVIPPSCNVCNEDSDCGGGTGQGCGGFGPFSCCTDRPKVDPASIAPKTPPLTCRNAVITASFVNTTTGVAMQMDRATINPLTVTLTNLDTGAPVTLNAGAFRFPSRSSFQVSPGLLNPDTHYAVTVKGDSNIADGSAEGVLNVDGVGMNGNFGGAGSWEFQTADTLCQLSRVDVEPSLMTFTTIGQSQGVTAYTYDQFGNPIAPIYGVYDWNWEWTSTADGIVTVSSTDGDGDSHVDADQTVTAAGNGTAVIRATAHAGSGWTGDRVGSASASVEACLSAWPPAPPFNDTTTNMSTWYCRDEGSLLAVNEDEGSGTYAGGNGVDELIKQFFFEYPDENPETHKHDAVGLLVYENEDKLSPSAWYHKKFNKSASSATFEVDGYPAMRIGTTTYVAATNLVGSTLYANMYVFGYNEDAGSAVSNIFSQMMRNLHLNSNAGAFAYSGTPSDVALQQVRTDMNRVGDLGEYATALAAYNSKTGSYPALSAGSYINGMSTSAWPSWTETLGQALQSTIGTEAVSHTDPVNTFSPACDDPYNKDTCWNERDKQFLCPANTPIDADDSHVYAYKFTEAGASDTYDLFAHLDYGGSGSWKSGDTDPCSGMTGSQCRCFNYSLQGVGGSGGTSEDSTPPTVPQHAQAVAEGQTSIRLNWDASSDFGGSGVRSYHVFQSFDGSSFTEFATVAHPVVQYVHSGLTPGTTLYYRLKAEDFAGNISGFSNTAQATTQSGGDIVPPGNSTALSGNPSGSTVVLTWNDPSDSDLAGLKVQRRAGSGTFSRDGAGVTTVGNAGAGIETITDPGPLTAGTYTFGVFAYDEVPNFASGVFVEVTITGGGGSGVQNPTNMTVVAGDRQLTTRWDDPSGSIAGVGVYYVGGSTNSFNRTDAGVTLAGNVAPGAEQLVVNGLTNGQVYTIGLFAFDGSTPPQYSSGTFKSGSPEAPSGFSQNVISFTASAGDKQVLLTWVNPADAQYSGVMIRRSTTGFPADETQGTFVADVLKTNPLPQQFTDVGLTNNTEYFYGAFAHNSVPEYANGAFDSAIPSGTPPLIQNVNVPMLTIGASTAMVTWTTNELATTVVQIGKTSSYELGIFADVSFTLNHSWKATDFGLVLTPNTQYHFRAISHDQQGDYTTDIDHVFVTDAIIADDPLDFRWEGYYETLPTASWNGSLDRSSGGCWASSCLQFYSCLPDGSADCSDARNSTFHYSTTCSALARADCFDGVKNLPEGGLTPAILNNWQGSRLPNVGDYNNACTDPNKPLGMPYAQGTWSQEQVDPFIQRSYRVGLVSGNPACNGRAATDVSQSSPFSIITPF